MAESVDTPANVPMTIGDLVAYSLYGLLAIAIIWIFFHFRRKLADQKEAQRISDAAFEAQMLRMARSKEERSGASQPMASALEDAMPIPTAAEPVHSTHSSFQQVQAGGINSVEDVYRQPADVVCASVVSQLRNSGLVEHTDSYIEVNGNPKGALVLRMTGGKHALLVPYFESEPFALRNLKRYDMVIFVSRNGKAVVLRSLEELIVDKVAGAIGGF